MAILERAFKPGSEWTGKEDLSEVNRYKVISVDRSKPEIIITCEYSVDRGINYFSPELSYNVTILLGHLRLISKPVDCKIHRVKQYLLGFGGILTVDDIKTLLFELEI